MSEIDEIRSKYDSGQLEEIRKDLERFIRVHREQILRYRDTNRSPDVSPLPDEVAIKLYILRHRSINPKREIEEQLQEINREKWIRGVQSGLAPDPQQVASEWSRLYSAGWRSHRVLSIVYVFEREKERYLRLLA